MKESINVGFIGLGSMGMPMARRVIGAGYPLHVWNRTAAKAQALVTEGAKVHETPKNLAQARPQVLLLCLSRSGDVREILSGPDGIAPHLAAGTIVVDHSSISPEVSRDLAKQLNQQNIDFLDAPVTGGVQGATDGKLTVMIGGDSTVLEKVQSVIMSYAQTIRHFGAIGAGQTAKICNQVAAAGSLLAAAEALALGRKVGLDPNLLLETLGSGAASSFQLTRQGPKMIAGDFRPAFALELLLKDLNLALEAAASCGQKLPGTQGVRDLAAQLVQAGYGAEGIQALIRGLA